MSDPVFTALAAAAVVLFALGVMLIICGLCGMTPREVFRTLDGLR